MQSWSKYLVFIFSLLFLFLAACTQQLETDTGIDGNKIEKENTEEDEAADINEVKTMEEFKIMCPDFTHNSPIPSKYTCDGENINPEIDIEGIPENAESLVLIVDDPDAPSGTWDHWIMFNIPPTTTILENSAPGIQGTNSWGKQNWGGPCPPSGTHRYVFKLYALDIELTLDSSARKSDVKLAMEGHILASAELIGLYSRQ